MLNNWDLLILNPILIVFSLISIFFMLVKEKSSFKTKLIYLEIFAFWFGVGLIIGVITNYLQPNGIFKKSLPFAILLFFGINFMAIIFKPLATFITGKIKNRRLWFWIANITMLLSIIFLVINLKILDQINYLLLYLTLILTGFSLSANTIHYLIVNEQTYYRLNPIGSTITVCVVMLFGNYLASYLVSFSDLFYNKKIETIAIIIAIIMVSCSLGLSFIKKENKNLVGNFSIEIRNELGQFKIIYLVYLSFFTFMIMIISEISGGIFLEEYLKLLLLSNKQNSSSQTFLYLRIIRISHYIPQILLGYWIYRYIVPQIGYKYHFMTSLLVISISLSIICFTKIPLLILIFQFIITLAIAQVFYGLFALSVMWNYRAVNIPVTGIVGSAGILAIYICDGVFKTLQNNHAGIFNYDNSISSLMINPQIDALKNTYSDVWNVVIASMVGLSLLMILMFYFTIDKVLNNYKNINEANLTMKTLERKSLINKLEQRIVKKGE
ncbi:hypothetical protein SSABA_v1c02260 [Spiroplasma sabaudiense Ar-1343]|uniref:Transmembrane protein n=1 Tax=Spiroplasma sabaudiense Ar-1343 TaxID=1276257 RepID=W6A916_9MOLU|nr:MFS cation transporter [Spiroplasma sabaudiense]AHI53638.1 hypothetical protein SSABA_v1c02260 [Spiroplasma sabaudiense Ar-1343]